MPKDNIYRGEIIPAHLYDFLEEHGGEGTALKFLKAVYAKYSIYEYVDIRRDWLTYALKSWYGFSYVLYSLRSVRLSAEDNAFWAKLQEKAEELDIKVEI